MGREKEREREEEGEGGRGAAGAYNGRYGTRSVLGSARIEHKSVSLDEERENRREREREGESVESIKSMVSQADTGSYRWGLTRRRMFGPVRSIGRPYRSPVVFISALFTPTCFFPSLVPRHPLPHLSFPSTRLDLLGVWREENTRVTSRRINVRMEYAILLSRVQRVIYSDRRFRTSIDDPGRIHFGAIGDAIGRKESKALEKRRKRTGVPRKSRERNKR